MGAEEPIALDEYLARRAVEGVDEETALEEYLEIGRDWLHREHGFTYTEEEWRAVARAKLPRAADLRWLRRTLETIVGLYVQGGGPGPFPSPTADGSAEHVAMKRVADAAKRLRDEMENYPLSHHARMGPTGGATLFALLHEFINDADLKAEGWKKSRKRRSNAAIDERTEHLLLDLLYIWLLLGGKLSTSFDASTRRPRGPLVEFLSAASAPAFEKFGVTPPDFREFVRTRKPRVPIPVYGE